MHAIVMYKRGLHNGVSFRTIVNGSLLSKLKFRDYVVASRFRFVQAKLLSVFG